MPASSSTKASSVGKTSVRCVGEQQRGEHEHRRQRERDLQRRVEDHRDREVRLVAGCQLDADDVLDGVAGDRDDHQPGELLAHVQRVDRGRQRRHEPVGGERGRRRSHSEGQRRRPHRPPSGCMLLTRRAAQETRERQHEEHEQHDGADERQRFAMSRRRRVKCIGQRWNRHRRRREHGQDRDHPRPARV